MSVWYCIDIFFPYQYTYIKPYIKRLYNLNIECVVWPFLTNINIRNLKSIYTKEK